MRAASARICKVCSEVGRHGTVQTHWADTAFALPRRSARAAFRPAYTCCAAGACKQDRHLIKQGCSRATPKKCCSCFTALRQAHALPEARSLAQLHWVPTLETDRRAAACPHRHSQCRASSRTSRGKPALTLGATQSPYYAHASKRRAGQPRRRLSQVKVEPAGERWPRTASRSCEMRFAVNNEQRPELRRLGHSITATTGHAECRQ